MSLSTRPFGHFAGQRATHGTRKPPSHVVPFSPLNGVLPPSGQLTTSAPLSVEKTTIVLSAMPRSSSFLSRPPTTLSSSAMPSAYSPKPLLFFHFSERCVHTWQRVELCHRKNGLLALCARSMKLSEALSRSSSTVSIRLVFSGPVSSIFWRPTRPHRGSSVASSVSVAHAFRTPRGPNFLWNSGS